MLRFYNTLHKKKEIFKPLENGYVGLYTCGPTVYDYAHIGNFRTYIFEDLLRRYLKYKGYNVKQVMNITDIDDKTIRKSNEEGIPLKEVTERYIDQFFKDLDLLRIERAEVYPRATEHIETMINLIVKLKEKGLAYSSDDGIYFPINKFEGYGKLSGFDISQVREGARVPKDEYSKEDARDFALWKFERPGEPSWDAPFGKGRPGWHIECSAMSMEYLGESFDIHTGGVDNIFPHHENEIAQSEGVTGKPFVNYWLHSEHLIVEGEKMSKSKGNYLTLKDLLDRGENPVAIRYLLLSTHYRKQLNFTYDGLKGAYSTIKSVWDLRDKLKDIIKKKEVNGNEEIGFMDEIEEAKREFEDYLDDDLSISPALASIYEFIKFINIQMDEGGLNPLEAQVVQDFFNNVDKVLDVFKPVVEDEIPEEIRDLAERRANARENGDYTLADEIRGEIENKGFSVEDTPDGYRVLKKR